MLSFVQLSPVFSCCFVGDDVPLIWSKRAGVAYATSQSVAGCFFLLSSFRCFCCLNLPHDAHASYLDVYSQVCSLSIAIVNVQRNMITHTFFGVKSENSYPIQEDTCN